MVGKDAAVRENRAERISRHDEWRLRLQFA
jgi:hypothetical protein